MALKIKDIPPEGVTFEVEEKLDLFEEGAATTPFAATVTVRPVGSGIFRITGTVNATAELECSRCLRRFPISIQRADMEFDLAPEGSLAAGTEHELGRSELDTEFYRGDEIEPKDFIREQILLALPMVPVHSEDCRGLCPVCGADKNERTCTCTNGAPLAKENPFAVLGKIIKPEKE